MKADDKKLLSEAEGQLSQTEFTQARHLLEGIRYLEKSVLPLVKAKELGVDMSVWGSCSLEKKGAKEVCGTTSCMAGHLATCPELIADGLRIKWSFDHAGLTKKAVSKLTSTEKWRILNASALVRVNRRNLKKLGAFHEDAKSLGSFSQLALFFGLTDAQTQRLFNSGNVERGDRVDGVATMNKQLAIMRGALASNFGVVA